MSSFSYQISVISETKGASLPQKSIVHPFSSHPHYNPYARKSQRAFYIYNKFKAKLSRRTFTLSPLSRFRSVRPSSPRPFSHRLRLLRKAASALDTPAIMGYHCFVIRPSENASDSRVGFAPRRKRSRGIREVKVSVLRSKVTRNSV